MRQTPSCLPVRATWRRFVKEQRRPPEHRRRPRTYRPGKVPDRRVRFCQGLFGPEGLSRDHAQWSTSTSAAAVTLNASMIAGCRHKSVRCPFSITYHALAQCATSMMCADTSATLLPVSIFSRSPGLWIHGAGSTMLRGSRSGGGPPSHLRAFEKEEQGVPNHTKATCPDPIRSSRRRRFARIRTSNCEP